MRLTMRLGLSRLVDCWAGHDVRAYPVSPGPLEAVSAPHLAALARAGATVINGKLYRMARQGRRAGSRLKDLHPQVLTIAP